MAETIYTSGTCTYCGQLLTGLDCPTQQEADTEATAQCRCEQAAADRRKAEQAELDVEDREENISVAAEKIDELAGDEISPELADWLKAGAAFVYDLEINRLIAKVPDGPQLLISKTNKGKFTVQRVDKNTREAVISS